MTFCQFVYYLTSVYVRQSDHFSVVSSACPCDILSVCVITSRPSMSDSLTIFLSYLLPVHVKFYQFVYYLMSAYVRQSDHFSVVSSACPCEILSVCTLPGVCQCLSVSDSLTIFLLYLLSAHVTFHNFVHYLVSMSDSSL